MLVMRVIVARTVAARTYINHDRNHRIIYGNDAIARIGVIQGTNKNSSRGWMERCFDACLGEGGAVEMLFVAQNVCGTTVI